MADLSSIRTCPWGSSNLCHSFFEGNMPIHYVATNIPTSENFTGLESATTKGRNYSFILVNSLFG